MPIEQSFVEVAEGLVPLLREHAVEADRTGDLPDVVADAIRARGLTNLEVPASDGGRGADIATAFEVHRTLAHGCSSTAWVTMILSGSGLLASALPGEARREVWGSEPDAAVASSLPQCGTAGNVEGGITVTGRWTPVSGVRHARWLVLAARRDGTAPVLAVLPIKEGTVERTWDTIGLRATRSDTVVLHDVFVPASRVLPITALETGSPGGRPFLPAAHVVLSAPLLGMAEAALEHTTTWLAQRQPPAESVRTLARAAGAVESAGVLLRALAGELDRAPGPDAAARARVRLLVARAAAELREAVSLSLAVFGSQGPVRQNPVERIRRDFETAFTHILLSMDKALDEYGPLLLPARDSSGTS
ncbi:acyl-CoA dehydrogenase family protein [Amycolatopsis ultiminotia]|uniref:Acyl-CoA dehydrogenase family protein n=1 Tax=Amycolatopsis ultiminotia TaxID=543629 RepID=A0ABP6WBT7_9PSEU